jgi:soluble cytochrome b562
MRVNIKDEQAEHQEAIEKMKSIIMTMNRLTEEEFQRKYQNDINFHTGFKFLYRLLLNSNLNA